MSESVRYFLESRVPELEDLFKKNLFSKEEIKEIVAKRTKFEHKIKRRGAILEDFLAYIQYETELEQTRKQRYEMLNIRAKHSVSDHSIVKYILSLYRRAVTKFRGNMSLWDQYINFASESKSDKSMPKILASALQLHPEAVDIWIKAASWELKHLNNPASARALFLRAIRINKESKSLWFEYFRMELEVANTLAEKKLELSEKNNEDTTEITVFDGAIAISVFKFASKECLLSFEEAFKYYQTSLEYENLNSVSEFIEKFVFEHMSNQYIFHVLKARVEVSSIDFDNENSIPSFEKCMCSLNAALESSSLSSNILSDIINVLVSVFEKTDGHQEIRSMIFEKMNRIFESGEKSKVLTADLYLLWIKISQNVSTGSAIQELIQRALKHFPESSELLNMQISCGSSCENLNLPSLCSAFMNVIKSSPSTCSDSLDNFFKKYQNDHNDNLMNLALSACNSFVPSTEAIGYVLKFSSEGELIKSFDHLRITPEFIVALINVLIKEKIFSETAKKFVGKFSIFSSKALNSKESALALIRYSLTIGDVDLCNRLYAKIMTSLPPSMIESFLNSFELLKESTCVLPF